jgi:hypothetical protein
MLDVYLRDLLMVLTAMWPCLIAVVCDVVLIDSPVFASRKTTQFIGLHIDPFSLPTPKPDRSPQAVKSAPHPHEMLGGIAIPYAMFRQEVSAPSDPK